MELDLQAASERIRESRPEKGTDTNGRDSERKSPVDGKPAAAMTAAGQDVPPQGRARRARKSGGARSRTSLSDESNRQQSDERGENSAA